jgi:FkbM family methyltransferase
MRRSRGCLPVRVIPMKLAKLGLTGVITALVCFSYYYLFDYNPLYRTLHCWKQAKQWSSCLREDHFDFVTEINGLRYEGNTGNLIDSNIFYFGAHEKHVLFFLRDVMKSGYGNNGVFLDIGANTGQHSLFMSPHARAIHAFEPYQPVLARFQDAVAMNGITNITIHPIGLGNENSSKPFYKPGESNHGSGSFVDGFFDANQHSGELDIRVGDEVLRNSGVTSIALVKMDIEGYEKPALQGLRRTLENSRPVVVFEMSIDPQSRLSIKTKDELRGLFPNGYDFFYFGPESNPESGRYVLERLDDRFRFDMRQQRDLVASPAEKTASFPHTGSKR